MAPAGGTEHILPFFLPPDVMPGEVFADGLPFVKDDVYRTGIFQGFGESVSYRLVLLRRKFGLKGSEQLIPDNEEHTHVSIQIFDIRRMVDPVMTGSHEDIFQPAHFVDQFGMDENAPDLGGGIHEKDIYGLETQECQGYEIDKTVQRLKDRRPEAHCEIEMFGRVVGDMYRPEKADLMVPAVQPVIKEVFRQQQQQPIGKDIGDRKPVMPVANGEEQEIKIGRAHV